MSALQTLEDTFVKYQRLNQILKDNWNDSTQEAFDANYLTPIATEWSMYHSSLTDMRARDEATQREINEDFEELDAEIRNLSEICESGLNGCAVYGIYGVRNHVSSVRNLLVEQRDLNHIDKEDIIYMAMNKFPAFEEFEDPHMIESIYIY